LELEERSKAAEQETVTNEVAKFMDSLDFEGVDPKDLFVNYTEEKAAASYGYVNAVIQSAVAKMKQAELANTNTLEATISALQEKYNQSEAANEQLNLELSNKTLEIADLNSRLTNATRMLAEEQAEVERLNSQVDDLRKEIAIGAAAASKVVEVDVRSTREIWEEERRKEEDAKPVIYNIRWKDDIRRDTYLAELAATDETIEIPYYAMNGDMKNAPTAMKGRYRVVASEEAPSFRTVTVEVQGSEHSDEDHSYDIPDNTDEVAYTAPAFRGNEDESTTGGLDQDNTGMALAGEEVTPEAFRQALERISKLELAVFLDKGEAA
jgi:peptidoglycan hydrolase CwlO-like protein